MVSMLPRLCCLATPPCIPEIIQLKFCQACTEEETGKDTLRWVREFSGLA